MPTGCRNSAIAPTVEFHHHEVGSHSLDAVNKGCMRVGRWVILEKVPNTHYKLIVSVFVVCRGTAAWRWLGGLISRKRQGKPAHETRKKMAGSDLGGRTEMMC